MIILNAVSAIEIQYIRHLFGNASLLYRRHLFEITLELLKNANRFLKWKNFTCTFKLREFDWFKIFEKDKLREL